jgi:hypothetical protein
MNVVDDAVEAPERPDVRAVGAIVAAVIALVIAVAGAWLIPAGGWVLGIVGLPGTTVVAWRLAPRAASSPARASLRVAVELTFWSIIVADVLVVVGLLGWAAMTGLATSDGTIDIGASIVTIAQTAVWSVAIVAIGAVFVGIPAAILVAPAAVAWVVIVRRVAAAVM